MHFWITTSAVPRWLLMWSLAVAIYAALKWWSWRNRRVREAPVWRHVAYLVVWPGMNADAFLDAGHASERAATSEWLFAIVKTAFGMAVLVFAVPWIAALQWDCYIVGWVGMVGIAFLMHFGVFHLLSCSWRGVGVCAPPIMQWPILSESVAEFWGRRWNLAFRDLSHRFVFRPLTPRIGASRAMLAGFLVSGLVHDLVITVPAGGGYGLPTAYFALQGSAVMLEHSRWGRALGLGHGLRGRLFALIVILTPVMWLFPRPFVCGVIAPFLEALGVIR
jgi:hypothetical protein